MFILMFWGLVAVVGSVIGAVILGGLVALITRRVTRGHKRAITIASFLPAAGFAYLFCCVAIFSIWSLARGQDMGWGDTWDTAILGSYNILMIDVTDQGFLYNHADRNVSDAVGLNPSDRDVVGDVRRLQVADPYILGSAGPAHLGHEAQLSPEDHYFIIDTRTNFRTDYGSLAELDNTAHALHLALALQSLDDVYNQHRYSRLDFVLAGFLALPPIFVVIILVYALMRLYRTPASTSFRHIFLRSIP